MELQLGYEILESYKRLSYKEWYALAEFVDNSTQSYRNNRSELDEIYRAEDAILTVQIAYDNSKENGFISIIDNALGMNYDQLQKALILGKKPDNNRERSKYGLGLKTAAFWFGDQWKIETTKLGESKKFKVTVDLQEILKEEQQYNEKTENIESGSEKFIPQLKFEEIPCSVEEHGTSVYITKLNRRLTPARANKSKEYLRSIYRCDLGKSTLVLFFQGEELTWSMDEIMNRIRIDRESGEKLYREFNFTVNDKNVHGWEGVLKHGSRSDAGFALLQSDRVIQQYKPSMLFGEQEGGINDLVNQRLFEEIFLDGFDVSHTKDEILFTDDEELLLDQKLYDELAHLKRSASEFRIQNDEAKEINIPEIVSEIVSKFNNTEFRAAVFKKDVLPDEVVEKTNEELYNRLVNTEPRIITAYIDDLYQL